MFVPLMIPGNALIKCGETEKQLGGAERELIQSAAINFLTPFRNFLEGDFKTILVSWTAGCTPRTTHISLNFYCKITLSLMNIIFRIFHFYSLHSHKSY